MLFSFRISTSFLEFESFFHSRLSLRLNFLIDLLKMSILPLLLLILVELEALNPNMALVLVIVRDKPHVLHLLLHLHYLLNLLSRHPYLCHCHLAPSTHGGRR